MAPTQIRRSGAEKGIFAHHDWRDPEGQMASVCKYRPEPMGYHRICVLLRQQGWPVNKNRVRRICRLEGLRVRMRGGRIYGTAAASER